jgi:hypothetical protein
VKPIMTATVMTSRQAVAHFFAFSPGSTSGRSVILLLQNHLDDEDQSGDDANLNSEMSDPFPTFHLPFALSPISTRRAETHLQCAVLRVGI